MRKVNLAQLFILFASLTFIGCTSNESAQIPEMEDGGSLLIISWKPADATISSGIKNITYSLNGKQVGVGSDGLEAVIRQIKELPKESKVIVQTGYSFSSGSASFGEDLPLYDPSGSWSDFEKLVTENDLTLEFSMK